MSGKIDLDRIEQVALAAGSRSPAPWGVGSTPDEEMGECHDWVVDANGENVADLCWLWMDTDRPDFADANLVAQHIANCSPDVVLALVQRIRELETQLEAGPCPIGEF
jgi:hypothetical protein